MVHTNASAGQESITVPNNVKRVQSLRIKNQSLSRLLIMLSLFLCAACSAKQSEKGTSTLPTSINEVQTYRMGENLIRVIRHNMEVEPRFDIELLSTPDFKVIDNLSVQQITADGEPLSFSESQGVFVEDFGIEGASVFVKFDYFYLHSGSDLILCSVEIEKEALGKLVCNKK